MKLSYALFISVALYVSQVVTLADPVRIYASQISGVVLDGSFYLPSTQTCSNNTALINTAIQTAAASGPVDFVIDGVTCLHNIVPSGSRVITDLMCLDLRGLSNITIEGQGPNTGFIVHDGEACAAISNESVYSTDGVTPPRAYSNLTFRNFRMEGGTNPGITGVTNALKVQHSVAVAFR